jgi:hypothetical protein
VGVTPYSLRVPFDTAVSQADRAMYERKKSYKEMRGILPERRNAARETPGWTARKPN